MLRQYELVERVKTYDPDADEELLNRAYVFSMKAHGTQLRASGDPYFSHPIEVAGILTDLELDDETVATAILHDTVEDTVATPEEIERLFGPSVARLVDGVTKLSRIEAQSDTERAAENLRRFLLAMSDDIRVLLVKLADRLHNMRTLRFIPKPEKRRRIARETMDIYAPLAERIGLYAFADELRNLAFAELEPEAHASIRRRLDELRADGGDRVKRIESGIRLALETAGLAPQEVYGREKQPWSIWRKMQDRHVGFEKLSDVIAFRVIVGDQDACYRALGILHRRWKMVPGRFKDFISTPKRNGYRSLHTTLQDRDEMRIEVQLRDAAMHAEAQFGLAAHWAYKQRTGAKGADYPWVRDLLEILEHAATPEELLEHTRMAMFQDQLFCFTPKGELIQLPKGSTPVDFAYAVHTSLGDTCVGAKVGGVPVPLRTKLANGDQVEILRSSAQQPDPAWEGFVVTAKARAAVRRFTRAKERESLAKTGAQLIDAIAERLGVHLSDDAIEAACWKLKLADRAALHVALARQTVTEAQVMEALVPGSAKGRRKIANRAPLQVEGADGGGIRMMECCMPVPGDRIVGVRQEGVGLDVHRIDCPHLADAESEEWIDLRWRPDAGPATARLKIVVRNEPGALAEAATVLAQAEGNIVALGLKERDRSFHAYQADVEVDDLKHLTDILTGLKAPRAVVSAERVTA